MIDLQHQITVSFKICNKLFLSWYIPVASTTMILCFRNSAPHAAGFKWRKFMMFFSSGHLLITSGAKQPQYTSTELQPFRSLISRGPVQTIHGVYSHSALSLALCFYALSKLTNLFIVTTRAHSPCRLVYPRISVNAVQTDDSSRRPGFSTSQNDSNK